ncbi:hypothetical protein DPMN_102497 [Dreissena polymorpha]|uniref:Uncharacterized protein n=1 Tax=Dreissena polymorpha TaxID=45954 RepID=A0A9D4LLH3_DREPO|nr:hypothetical protein DPMN_102497 [Dreissena polymorpha]
MFRNAKETFLYILTIYTFYFGIAFRAAVPTAQGQSGIPAHFSPTQRHEGSPARVSPTQNPAESPSSGSFTNSPSDSPARGSLTQSPAGRPASENQTQSSAGRPARGNLTQKRLWNTLTRQNAERRILGEQAMVLEGDNPRILKRMSNQLTSMETKITKMILTARRGNNCDIKTCSYIRK